MSRPELPPNAVHPGSRAAWRAWLAEHHERPEGVWLVYYKKAAGVPDVTYVEAVEEALCFGWVDSKGNVLDDRRTMLWMAPRKPGSGWAATNKARVARLEAEGLMHPAGQAKVDAARADGSWALLDTVERLEVPTDLTEAFARHPGSAAHYDAFPPSARKAILDWIQQAKRPETRAKRVEEAARLAAENVRANQWKRP